MDSLSLHHDAPNPATPFHTVSAGKEGSRLPASNWPGVARVTRWLKKHGYLRRETDSNEAPALSFEETLAKAAMSRGTMTTLREDDGEPDASEEATRPATTEAVVHQGFNLHASVTIAADDDMGRERLCS